MVLLCSSGCQAFDGPASLLFSCRCWCVGEREAMVMAPPPTHDSAVSPWFHGCLAFLHRHFPLQSPLSHPLGLSLHSQQQPSPLGSLHTPETPDPSRCPFQGTSVLVQAMYGCGKDCLILIPLRLPQISCFTLSLKCFSSDSDNCPDVGIRPLLQFPHPPRVGPVLLTLLCFSPSSFILPSFAWFYVFCFAGQLLLSTLSWCPECTSVSEHVFLIYPWREMYFTSTYSSTI